MTPLQRNAYYLLKPVIPVRIRSALRRWRASARREKYSSVWPIKPGSEHPPDGWAGWPEGRRFAFVLTHDVESQLGVDRVRQLAELEMSLGFRSSFNFIPEGPYRVSPKLRHWLVDQGFEVGVHDLNHDGKLFRSREGFRRRAGRINHYLKEWNAVGFRAGFMHHNLPWIHDLNVAYDASTFDTDPFEPQPDGVDTIFPFWVAGSDGGGYVELPYTLVQDFNLFVILQEKTPEIWKTKFEWIAAHGGMALVVVHPDYTSFDGAHLAHNEFPVSLYQEFLQWVKARSLEACWYSLPRDVADFYRKVEFARRTSVVAE